MTKRVLILLTIILGLGFSGAVQAQKELKPLRALIKDKKGADAAKMVENLVKDSAMALEPRLYDYGKEAQILINDEENEKIYLGKSYDTIRFFNSTYGIFDYILQCEQVEQKRLAEERKKMKYHKSNGSTLRRYYPNLCAAGRYFHSKKNYSEVVRFMDMVLEVPTLPIWGDNRKILKEDDYIDNAYLYLRSAYFSKDYVKVEKYKDLVLQDTAYRYSAMEMLTLSRLGLKDTIGYVDYLVKGLREYPLSPFYFSRLTDHLTEKKDYRRALALADSMLTIDKNNVLFLVSKSVSLLNLQRNVEAIEVSQKILDIDSTIVAPLFYIGAAYCNLANELKLPTNINSLAYKTVAAKQKYYYTEARPYMERYRVAMPEEKKRWAPLLYRIYLSLNMGKKFEEIEKIL